MSTSEPDRETVTIELQLKIAGEEVQFQVTIPAGPATWDDLLPFMRSLVGVANQIAEERSNAIGKHVSCQAGCGICCRQCVPIAEFEARRLREVIEQMPEPRQTEIRRRFKDAAERLADAGLLHDQKTLGAMTPDDLVEYSKEYFRCLIPCPFLEDESCSIHPERPLKCREHLVSSPAEFCADPENNPVEVMPLPLHVSRATLVLEANPRSTQSSWLPLTSLFLSQVTETPPTASKTGPELLQQFMSTLTQRR